MKKRENVRTWHFIDRFLDFFSFFFSSVFVFALLVCLSSGGVQRRDVTGRPVIDLLPQTVARCQHGQDSRNDYSSSNDDNKIIGRQTEEERKWNE
jgi:hypothetical protein